MNQENKDFDGTPPGGPRWAEDMIAYLAEDIRETKKLTKAVRAETKEIASLATEAKRQADASWELVVITRNEMHRPWYKKLLGIQN